MCNSLRMTAACSASPGRYTLHRHANTSNRQTLTTTTNPKHHVMGIIANNGKHHNRHYSLLSENNVVLPAITTASAPSSTSTTNTAVNAGALIKSAIHTSANTSASTAAFVTDALSGGSVQAINAVPVETRWNVSELIGALCLASIMTVGSFWSPFDAVKDNGGGENSGGGRNGPNNEGGGGNKSIAQGAQLENDTYSHGIASAPAYEVSTSFVFTHASFQSRL